MDSGFDSIVDQMKEELPAYPSQFSPLQSKNVCSQSQVAVPHPWTIYCPASFVGDTREDAMRTGPSRARLGPACPDSPFSL